MISNMFSNKHFLPLIFLIVKLSLFFHKIEAATPTFISHACQNTTSSLSTPNTTYSSNLNLLLTYLSSNTTRTNGFYQTTVGGGTSDAVTGLFNCRGDVNTTICQTCINNASKDVIRRCPVEKLAVIWYDVCWIRYADGSTFATTPGIVPSTSNVSLNKSVSDPNQFNQLLAGMMDSLANKASNSQTGKKFATNEEKYTSSETMYGLVQCTPDLSVGDCNTCLRAGISGFPMCCNGQQGGINMLPSCIVRYETQPFYDLNASGTSVRSTPGRKKKLSVTIVAIILPIVIVALLFSIGFIYLRRRSKKKYNFIRQDSVVGEIANIESLQYDFVTIEASTNNFSDDNKIGEGGFGVVYKGTLPNGEKIAVKRLLRSSGQGAIEFKNEVVLVAKLQHRNLVRLLGFCLEGVEKILVYEYVPNKSLDFYLFDHARQIELDWATRYKIIAGIARGIIYLHEDSRLRIIHRDLKASNILLDLDMNPKISDFGMAKVFVVDQSQGTTGRIVGTYGYMSPEYAMHGQFSIKSDVFSFGVLVLEILSGKKNNCFHQSHGSGDLLSFAWEHWRNRTPLELLDPSLGSSYSRNEVMRCIHMGLLCVQENPASRPSMATIILMLNSYSVTLPLPQQPAFYHQIRSPTYSQTNKSISWSVNDESMITEVYPR